MKTIIILFLFANIALAETSSECLNPKDSKTFIECALLNHPQAQEAQLDESRAEGVLKNAKQFPNPELEMEFSETDNIGLTSKNVDLRLMFPIEYIGGKRGARIEKGKAEADLIKFEASKSIENVAAQTVINLYRMRQILDEIELTKESLTTFASVKRQYSQRKSLGPEQSVSLDIFGLAEADYSMRLSALEAEKSQLASELSRSIGQPFIMDKENLPRFKTSWPSLSDESEIIGPDIQILKAQSRLAEGALAMAKSEAWPSLSVGPTYSSETQNNDRITTVGISVQMPLPIFNLNGGAKASARAEKRIAEIKEKSQANYYRYVRKNLVDTYRRITERLTTINLNSLGHSKHKRIHKYLKRGVVEASLVIESHRQIVEFQEHTNQQELEALKAYLQVRSFDGELLQALKGGEL